MMMWSGTVDELAPDAALLSPHLPLSSHTENKLILRRVFKQLTDDNIFDAPFWLKDFTLIYVVSNDY